MFMLYSFFNWFLVQRFFLCMRERKKTKYWSLLSLDPSEPVLSHRIKHDTKIEAMKT